MKVLYYSDTVLLFIMRVWGQGSMLGVMNVADGLSGCHAVEGMDRIYLLCVIASTESDIRTVIFLISLVFSGGVVHRGNKEELLKK